MKLKQTTVLLVAVGLAASTFGQGVLNFQNSGTSAVVDSLTGAPALSGLYDAGLYFNANLSAIPDVSIPDDGWVLVAQTPVIKPTIGTAGQYRGGVVEVPGVNGGVECLVQVRGWSQAFDTYAQAFAANAFVGASAPLKIKLGGSGIPTPTLGASGISGFTMTPVPEPSTIVLGLLGGLGAMVLLRRRQ